MNMDNANKWLTFAANVGVMIGIIFLIVELKQDASIASANSFQQSTSEYSEWRAMIITDKELSQLWQDYIFNPEEVREEDGLRMAFILMNLFAIYENAFYAERYGVFGEIEWEQLIFQSCEHFNRANSQGRDGIFDFMTTDYVEFLEANC